MPILSGSYPWGFVFNELDFVDISVGATFEGLANLVGLSYRRDTPVPNCLLMEHWRLLASSSLLMLI